MEDFLYKFLHFYQFLPGFLKKITGRLYNSLPVSVKHGNFYFIYSKRLSWFQAADNLEIITAEQTRLLFECLDYALENIPYYRNYQKCKTLEDFKKLPVISKSIMSLQLSRFVNPAIKRLKTNTGGSSGTPFEFYIEKNISRPKEKAHFDWYWSQFGYSPNDKIMMVRGLPLPGNKSFEYLTINNTLNISCYNVNEKNIPVIHAEIKKFQPAFIHAYPSSLKILTSLLEPYRNTMNLSIKAIFLGSEQLTKPDRYYFENFYNAKVINWYGHTERLIHGGNCPLSEEFHFYPSYGYMELLDENDQPVTRPGMQGRIVATGFDNKAMPFIRYDTGDIGVLSEKKECACGFKGTSLRKIIGRSQDFIILSDGTRVSLTAFIFGQHLKEFKKIREMQITQDKIGEIEISIVRSQDFYRDDEESFLKTLLDSVDNKLKIKIKYVDNLSKTCSGKHVFFISSINN
jgi:phenylacetate-CoA ligase